MRILVVHQHLGSRGGAETYIEVTAEHLGRRGHALGLLYHQPTGRNHGVWQTLFSATGQIRPANPAQSVRALLASFGPDVIYLQNLSCLDSLQVLLDSGVPVVRMVHDHALYCMRAYKYNYFTRRACTRPFSGYCAFPCLATVTRNTGGRFPVKWNSYEAKKRELELNRQCRHFMVYSDYCRQELIRNGFDGRRITLHVPIRGAGHPCAGSTFSDRNLILYTGQIVRGKGVDVLLRALALVPEPFECLIFGDGSHRAKCESLAKRLGLADRVSFRGYVAPAELQQYYTEASLVAVSSVWPEPFGMVGPEAMRHGLPVVAFDSGGIREWLKDGENGFLVPWMDTRQFAARIGALLRNKDLAREMGMRGLQRVNRLYQPEAQIGILEDVLLNASLNDRSCNERIPVLVLDGDRQ